MEQWLWVFNENIVIKTGSGVDAKEINFRLYANLLVIALVISLANYFLLRPASFYFQLCLGWREVITKWSILY